MTCSSHVIGFREKVNVERSYRPAKEVHFHLTHSMPPQKIEILKSLEGWAEKNWLTLLKPVEKCWQPQDFLPEPESDGFCDQVKELRERTKELSDDYFVVLMVGDMIKKKQFPHISQCLTLWMEFVVGRWEVDGSVRGRDVELKILFVGYLQGIESWGRELKKRRRKHPACHVAGFLAEKYKFKYGVCYICTWL